MYCIFNKKIYIYKALCVFVCLCVRYTLFVPRRTNISHTQERGDKQIVCPRGTNIFYTYRMGGGQTNCLSPGDKHFYTKVGGQTFSVEGGGDNYDVDGEDEEDVSEANIHASKASKLSAGARILRGP